MTEASRLGIVIIGGGFCGLSAAFSLGKRGFRVANRKNGFFNSVGGTLNIALCFIQLFLFVACLFAVFPVTRNDLIEFFLC